MGFHLPQTLANKLTRALMTIKHGVSLATRLSEYTVACVHDNTLRVSLVIHLSKFWRGLLSERDLVLKKIFCSSLF